MVTLKLIREGEADACALPVSNLQAAYAILDKECFAEKRSLWQEQLWMLTLDAKNHVTGKFHASSGAPDRVTIDLRTLAIVALQNGAASVILAHNHPNGNPVPGQADIAMTEKVRRSMSAIGITLLDHIVVADDAFYSMQEERSFPVLAQSA